MCVYHCKNMCECTVNRIVWNRRTIRSTYNTQSMVRQMTNPRLLLHVSS